MFLKEDRHPSLQATECVGCIGCLESSVIFICVLAGVCVTDYCFVKKVLVFIYSCGIFSTLIYVALLYFDVEFVVQLFHSCSNTLILKIIIVITMVIILIIHIIFFIIFIILVSFHPPGFCKPNSLSFTSFLIFII